MDVVTEGVCVARKSGCVRPLLEGGVFFDLPVALPPETCRLTSTVRRYVPTFHNLVERGLADLERWHPVSPNPLRVFSDWHSRIAASVASNIL